MLHFAAGGSNALFRSEAWTWCCVAMPLPKFENTELIALEEQFRDIVKQAEELSAHSERRMKEIEEELIAVQSEKASSSHPTHCSVAELILTRQCVCVPESSGGQCHVSA